MIFLAGNQAVHPPTAQSGIPQMPWFVWTNIGMFDGGLHTWRTPADQAPMCADEIAQSESRAGRRTFDGLLILFICAVAAVIALGAGGVI